MTTYLIPPVAIVIAWLLLGEIPPALALLGGVLCIVGVIIVRTPALERFRRRDPVEATTPAS